MSDLNQSFTCHFTCCEILKDYTGNTVFADLDLALVLSNFWPLNPKMTSVFLYHVKFLVYRIPFPFIKYHRNTACNKCALKL